VAQANNLDFNIAMHTKGMEQIATLINRVNALEAETKKLASANAGLSASTDTVIRNGTRYNNALDAQSKALRNARQGTQQMGMQINDFVTSVSTGASPIQAFNQQIGQVGYAMSMMGGTTGKVGEFLAGPWGAAVMVAAMALGPLIGKLFETSDEMKKAEKAAKDLDAAVAARKDSEYSLRLALADTAAEYRAIRKEMVANAMAAVNAAAVELRARQKVVSGLLAERRAMQAEVAGAGGMRAQAEMGTGQILDRRANTTALQDATTLLNGQIAEVEQLTAKLNAATVNLVSGGGPKGKSARKAAATDAEKQAKKLAESEVRWARFAAGERVEEYDDARKRDYQGAEAFTKLIAELDANATKQSMENFQERANGIAALTETLSEQTAQQIDRPLAELANSFAAIGASVSDAFKGMLTGAMSWKEGMRGIISSVINELWRLYVVQQIVGLVSSGLKSLGLPLPKIPGNANGTVNWGGGMTWVGERGPELVNLPKGSQVIPSHRAQNMAGGGVTVNVDARGSADPAAVRQQVEAGIRQAAPAIIAAAQQRTVTGLRRPKLGGVMQ
jgi:hypothetical protein